MNSSYIDIAQQDRGAAGKYITVFIYAVTMALMLSALIIATLNFKAIINGSLNSEYDLPLYSFLIIFIMLIICFKWALKKFHDREISAVINSFGFIRYRRFFASIIVSLMLIPPRYIVSFLTNPSKYVFSFESEQWISMTPFIIIVSLFLGRIFAALFMGYVLQGLSLLTTRINTLALIFGALIEIVFVLSYVLSENDYSVWLPLRVFLTSSFSAFVILKDNGIELIAGNSIANYLFQIIVRNPGDDLVIDSLNPVFYVNPPYNWLFNFSFTSFELIIFYLIFFNRDIFRALRAN